MVVSPHTFGGVGTQIGLPMHGDVVGIVKLEALFGEVSIGGHNSPIRQAGSISVPGAPCRGLLCLNGKHRRTVRRSVGDRRWYHLHTAC